MPRPVESALPAIAELTRTLDALSADKVLASDGVSSSLLNHVKACFREAELAKNTNGIVPGLSITQMLLESQDRRNSIHTADMKAKIKAQGLPNFYEPLTDQKCRDALAWWHDATVSYGDDWFRGEATEEPELPQDLMASVEQEIMEWEFQSRQNAAAPLSPDELRDAADKLYAMRVQEVKEKAKERAERMSSRIKDQLQDIDFKSVRDAFRLDLVTFGTAFYWGPFVKSVKKPAWKNGKRTVADVMIPWLETVSPLDLFPAPWMTDTTDHGYICRRMKIHPGSLAGFLGVPGWQDDAIKAIIAGQNIVTTEVVTGDSERAKQEGKDQLADPRGDFIWFVGHVKGSLLKSYGADFADESKEYHVHVCWMGNHLLRVKLNWNNLEIPPCSKAVYDEIAGSFWGLGVPMKMRASQDKANSIIIPMLDNAGWAAGGVTEIDQYRMINPGDANNWGPRNVILLKDPENGTTLPAVRHTNIPLLCVQFGRWLQDVSNEADEQSGVRKYSMGNDRVAGAGRTRGGLAMLMDASSKTLKSSMYRADKAEADQISMFADWNNEFGPEELHGDIKIITSGASGFFIQEFQIQQMNSMIDRLLNPALIQVPGMMEQVISLIKELGRSMRVDMRYIPNHDEIAAKIEDLRQKAAQAEQLKAEGGGANNAGSPPSSEQEQPAQEGQ